MLVPTLRLSLSLEFVETEPDSVQGKITAPVTRALIPVGEGFQAHARRVVEGRSFEDDDRIQADLFAASNASSRGEEFDEDAVSSEEEDKYLLKLDPKEWKEQDHYAVLGLSKLRYKATLGQINYAHRKKVLKHHPDKKANLDGDANDDAFFKCIQKAYDQLSDPVKRRSYDSVDEGVSNEGPADVEPDEFIQAWAPIFEREARFSKKEPVPGLGTLEDTKPQVETFYDFWYNFDSWRSLEYKDKEVNEGSDSRDDKRYAERKNKAERAKMKNDDNGRLRALVDRAIKTDPRIKRFRQEEKAAREAKRKGKPVSGQQAKAQNDAKQKEEEEKAKVEQAKKDAEDKVLREANKKSKEAAKKNLKKDKKAIRTAVTGANYFVPAGETPSPSLVEGQLTELDSILDALEPEDVAATRTAVEKAGSDPATIRSAIAESGKKAGVTLRHFEA